MARNMSFMLTTGQIRNGTKSVTRRVGWGALRPGDIVNACVKCQGLKKGQKVEVIRQIEIISVLGERLRDITPQEVVREGFPDMTPTQFVEMFCKTHKGCDPDTVVMRIAFEYVDRRESWQRHGDNEACG